MPRIIISNWQIQMYAITNEYHLYLRGYLNRRREIISIYFWKHYKSGLDLLFLADLRKQC